VSSPLRLVQVDGRQIGVEDAGPHGLADTAAPPDHSRWPADRIPKVTAHFPAEEDHTNVEEKNRGAAIAWVLAHMERG